MSVTILHTIYKQCDHTSDQAAKTYFLLRLNLEIVRILPGTSLIVYFLKANYLIIFKILFQIFVKCSYGFKGFLIYNILPVRASDNPLRHILLMGSHDLGNNLDAVKIHIALIGLIDHIAGLTAVYNLRIFQYIFSVLLLDILADNGYSIVIQHKSIRMFFQR